MQHNGQIHPDSPPPKATFFCPACGHAGRITEDLVCHGVGPHRSYACPDCGTTITSRPSTPPTHADRDGTREICHSD
jgi:predicted RNA-binding Zn-ribbon protein involved in translation (DUF1610 family)